MAQPKNNPVGREVAHAGVLSDTEPRVGKALAPLGLLIAIGFLAYLGQAELGYNNGLFSPGVYEPYADSRSIPKPPGEGSLVDVGRELYLANCAVCHQPSGGGDVLKSCPPLAKSDWVLAEGPARVIRIALHGARGPITVNEKVWPGASGMVPFKDALPPERIAAILTYVRQSPEWGNNAGPVTAEQVKAVLDKESSRSAPWSADQLLKIPVTEN